MLDTGLGILKGTNSHKSARSIYITALQQCVNDDIEIVKIARMLGHIQV